MAMKFWNSGEVRWRPWRTKMSPLLPEVKSESSLRSARAGDHKLTHKVNSAGFWFFVKWAKIVHYLYSRTKKAVTNEKSGTAAPKRRFDEKSKPCNEKFVLFTKNPVCAYILFIYANRKYFFSFASPPHFAIFRWFFVENEKFSFFSFLLKF